MSSAGSDEEPIRRELTDDQRKHLDLIQGAVGRMATASTTAKGWLLPVATATYGYAIVKRSWPVAALGIGAVLLFGFLDAHYLRQERAFRALYRGAVEGRVSTYDLNNSVYYKKPRKGSDGRPDNCQWPSILRSWALLGFYGPAIAAGIAIAWRVLATRP